MDKIELIADSSGERIDRYLAVKLKKTRSLVQKLIKDGNITVEEMQVKPGYIIKGGEKIRIILPEPQPAILIPEPIEIEVLYKDDYIIVVNKPPGLVVYPAAGHSQGTLMNAIAYRVKKLATIGAPLRPGVVHRLDKDTSGVMVVALHDGAYHELVRQFSERIVQKQYLAIIFGTLNAEHGVIDLPIGRSSSHRKKFSTKTTSPKEAKTLWTVVESFKYATIVKINLLTGRTHQIRVHFSAIGHPVLGDPLYGRKTSLRIGKKIVKIPRQMLHAESIAFYHPITGKLMRFEARLPEDMKNVIAILRNSNN